MFQVNVESRAIALREFSVLSFSPGQIGIPPKNVYINFSSGSLWLCADLLAEWARNLLETNEQLKTQLKSLVVKERLWRELNPILHVPPNIPDIMAKWQQSNSVYGALEALVDVRFHG